MVALGSPPHHTVRRRSRPTAFFHQPAALLDRTEIRHAFALFGLLVVLTFLAAGWTAIR